MLVFAVKSIHEESKYRVCLHIETEHILTNLSRNISCRFCRGQSGPDREAFVIANFTQLFTNFACVFFSITEVK